MGAWIERSAVLAAVTTAALSLAGCTGEPGSSGKAAGAAESESSDPNAGIYVASEYDSFDGSITFFELTLLPDHTVYNRVPGEAGSLTDFDCARDRSTTDKWARCGTWSAAGATITVALEDSEPQTCTRTETQLDCARAGKSIARTYDRADAAEDVELAGKYVLSYSTSSTIYDQKGTLSSTRSIDFRRDGTFQASSFTGYLASSDGTIANDGYRGSTTAAGDVAGTYKRLKNAIELTLDDGTIYRSRFFTIRGSKGELVWIYVGGYGYLG